MIPTTIAACVVAAMAVAGYLLERRKTKKVESQDLNAAINDRLQIALRGPGGVFDEYEAEAKILVARMQRVAAERDQFAAENDELRVKVRERDFLATRVDELETEVRRLRGEIADLKAADRGG